MATRTLTSLYEYFGDAVQTVRDLEAAGVRTGDISIIAPTSDGKPARPILGSRPPGIGHHAAEDARFGAVVGAGVGLLAGLGLLSIQALAPVIAIGWPVPTAIGAAAGAVLGALAGTLIGALAVAAAGRGYPRAYEEGLRRGGTLVSVRTKRRNQEKVSAVLRRHQPAARTPRQAPGGAVWAGFNRGPVPYAATDDDREAALTAEGRLVPEKLEVE